jgi:hypothetical protein
LYYLAKLKEIDSNPGNNSETALTVDKSIKHENISPVENTTDYTVDDYATKISNETFEEPDDETYTINIPSSVSDLEVDVIRLAAQFTAKNGKAFLTGLFQREQSNPLFSFIRPNNCLFSVFTKMVDTYQRIIDQHKKAQRQLTIYAEDRKAILIKCLKRLQLDKENERERKLADEKAENERSEMMSVEWHDFIAVDTIEFFDAEDENLPEPLSLKDVILFKMTNEYKVKDVLFNDAFTISKVERNKIIPIFKVTKHAF